MSELSEAEASRLEEASEGWLGESDRTTLGPLSQVDCKPITVVNLEDSDRDDICGLVLYYDNERIYFEENYTVADVLETLGLPVIRVEERVMADALSAVALAQGRTNNHAWLDYIPPTLAELAKIVDGYVKKRLLDQAAELEERAKKLKQAAKKIR